MTLAIIIFGVLYFAGKLLGAANDKRIYSESEKRSDRALEAMRERNDIDAEARDILTNIASALKLIAARMEPDEEDDVDGETGGPVDLSPVTPKLANVTFDRTTKTIDFLSEGLTADPPPSLGFPPPESR